MLLQSDTLRLYLWFYLRCTVIFPKVVKSSGKCYKLVHKNVILNM